MKTKKVFLFDPQSCYFVTGVMAFMCVLITALCVFFFRRFVLAEGEVGGGLMLIAMLVVPCTYIAFMDWKTLAIRRFMVRCWFDANGIHCGGLLCPKYTIRWDEIHVYGTYGYSFSYAGICFIFFSKDETEYFDPKKVAEFKRTRIFFGDRPELWPELGRYMPLEMKKRLQNSLAERRDCYYRQ